MDSLNIDKRISLIEDRMALKHLVDTFSILADQKAIQKQSLLFTSDATCETAVKGHIVSTLIGRNQIAEAFASFLNKFEVVYHLNGQQTLELSGDRATGISYCMMVLLEVRDGVASKNSVGIQYTDRYIKENGNWLIEYRKGTFAWQDQSSEWGDT